MTYRDTGGTDVGDDAGVSPGPDLDQLRRTSPRRAARLEAERARDGGFAAAPHAPQAEPFDQYADVQPHEETVAHGEAVPDGQPVAHHGEVHHDEVHHDEVLHNEVLHDDELHHDELHHDEVLHDEAHHDELHHDGYVDEPEHDVFGGPFRPGAHDAFGDPVSDGYVPVAPAVPRRRRRPRWVGLLALVLTVGVVGVAGWYAYQGLRPVIGDLQSFELFEAAEDYEGAGTGSVEVVVNPGDTGRQMGQTLLEADVVASVEAFVEAANADPRFTSVQPGTYTMPQQLPAADAVAALLDPANRSNETVVIAEGLRVDQILDRLADRTGLPRDDLAAAVAAAELPPAAAGAEGVVDPAEGFLYPDGYQFADDVTAQQVVDQMIARGQQVLADLGVAPENQLEVLTKASLVQGEARIDDDFGRVAQVVDNRLAINQPLGLDSTVNYATQTFDTRTTAEQRASDSPYNTYRFPGLPPGPIKSPGRQAIEAVVAPTPGPWLYFVTTDLCTGETAFAETFEEHQANVQVLNAWQRENTAEDGSLICG